MIYSRPWVSIWQHDLRQNKESQEGSEDTDSCRDDSFLASCSNKTTTNPTVSMKEGDLTIIQESLDDNHQVFVDLVRSSRGSRLQTQEDIFTGRQSGALSLVESFIDLIYFHDVSTLALLCHKEPARRIQSPKGILLAPRWFFMA